MSDVPGRPPGSGDEDGRPAPARRTFLQAVGAALAGALASIPPVVAGAATLLHPLRREETVASAVRVASLTGLPEGGAPRRVTVIDDRVDAWTSYEATPVGAVYLRREGDRISALNVVCPHAGCSVNLAPNGTHFACPCHRSRFALDGTREEGPAPRDLDALEVEVRNETEVWVRFQNFRPGTEEKIPM
ncbi:MAG: Rieske (2Fe-2S) protein [Gemmatimonadota bacterium]|nr:Rieske (2Fe-2S) protein [Gemmatimonadota bacterium]